MKNILHKLVIGVSFSALLIIAPLTNYGQTFSSANVGSNQSICEGEFVSLGGSAIAGHSYSWTPASNISSTTASQPMASPTTTTIYYLTEYDSATSVQFTDSVIITVNPIPAAITGADKAICPGQSVQIGTTPVNGNTYAWDPIKGLSSFMVSQPTAYPKETTIYYLTETITATGCDNTNGVVVTVNPLPEAYTGPDKNLCFGRLTEIGTDPVPGNTYIWSPEDGLSIPDISQPAVTASATTTFTLTEVNLLTGCRNSNSVTVSIVKKPDVPTVPTGITELCQFSMETQIATTAINGAIDYKWSISPSNAGTLKGTSNNVLVDWSENFSGMATIMVSGLNSCGASANSNPLAINIKQAPVKPIITLAKGILTSSSADGNQWFDESGPISGAIDQTFKPVLKGIYSVVVQSNDCSSKPSNLVYVVPSLGDPYAINEVAVAEKVQIYPNPNSGTFTLQVSGLDNKPFDLAIYNSVGKIVYQRNNQYADANSGLTINMQDMEQGVYILNIHSEKLDQIAKVVVRR